LFYRSDRAFTFLFPLATPLLVTGKGKRLDRGKKTKDGKGKGKKKGRRGFAWYMD